MTAPSQTESNDMHTSRLEAFSDGVMAVLITIMVLELKAPDGVTLSALKSILPKLLVYILSFVFIAIYWNNHHHLLRATRYVSAGVMWANLHLLFWLSLIPAVTAWLGEHPGTTWPTVAYGVIGAMTGVAYFILTKAIIYADSKSGVAKALDSDFKGASSVILYLVAVVAAFINPLFSYLLYASVAIMWFIPDRRLEPPPPNPAHS